MQSLISSLSAVFVAALVVVAASGLLGWFTLYVYLKVRRRVLDHALEVEIPARDRHEVGRARSAGGNLPRVTVQIPIFNERLVVRRAIRAAGRLDYPRERLQVQIVDDSNDDTTAVAAKLVEKYQAEGLDIELVHRDHRAGYKAGALAAALERATGEYVAILDADFEPGADFLRRTIACFDADPALGLVQTRWGHLNGDASLLTAAQAISIDRHFAVDLMVRFGADYFPKFSGSAGVWRRTCIDDAGGWHGDTLCEDLCLSTRAFLRGWRFQLLPHIAVPAEIPDSISAFKNQQERWSQGSVQCLIKYGREILAARRQPLTGRVYVMLKMSGYMTALMPIVMLLCLVPLVALGWKAPLSLSLVVLAAAGQPIVYITAQRALYPRWWRRMIHLATLMIVAVGMSPAVTRGALRAVTGRVSPFVRTVKGRQGWRYYRQPFDGLLIGEMFLTAYAAVGLAACVVQRTLRPVPFFLACLAGFGYVSLKGLQEQWSMFGRRARALAATADSPAGIMRDAARYVSSGRAR